MFHLLLTFLDNNNTENKLLAALRLYYILINSSKNTDMKILILQSSIIKRMASQNQKSILSLITLETSKINKESLSTSILPPLHTGGSSYIAYKHKKSSRNQSRPLPFGSTATRVAEQLQPKFLSHVVSYTSVESGFKHYSENISSPFGSSDNRFKDNANRSPGPGMYKLQQTNQIKHSSAGWKFSKVERDLSNQKNTQISVCPGSYQIENLTKSFNSRQKMAQKYRQQRKKYVQLLGNCSNKQIPDKFIGFNQTKNQNCDRSNEAAKQKPKKPPLNTITALNRFTLKDSTKKYVQKQDKQIKDYPRDHISFINRNFTHHFIEKADNAFSSYIPKVNDIPGPGYYIQKPQNHPLNQSFNFKSNSVRTLFPVNEANIKKQKPKLSQLL